VGRAFGDTKRDRHGDLPRPEALALRWLPFEEETSEAWPIRH